MKARVLALLLVLLTGLIQTPVNAGTNTNCIKAQNARSFQSDSSLTLTVDLYWNCTDAPMSGGVIYSVPEDISARCSGPSYASKASSYTSTYAGVVECSINTTNSSRAGSTRSTIKIWSSYDFSTNNVTISHTAIPSKSTPTPTPTPTPKLPETSNGDFTTPENSTSVLYDKQYCVKRDGETKWNCLLAPLWEASYCTQHKKVYLEIYRSKMWKKVYQVETEYNEYYCPNSQYPILARNVREENLKIGTYKYRLNFVGKNGKSAYYQLFTLKSVMGEVGVNAM